MAIIDTHVHTISNDTGRYPRGDNPPSWANDLPSVAAEDLIRTLDAGGVDKAVLVQPFGIYGYDNTYTVESARRFSERFVSVGLVDLLAADTPEVLSKWAEKGMAGIRFFRNPDNEAVALDDPRMHAAWQAAADLTMPVTIQLPFAQLGQLKAVIGHFSNLKVAIDHLARPPVEGGPPFTAASPLFEMATYPNVYLKFMTPLLDQCQSAGVSVHDLLHQVVDAFGAERLMWGSNYPASRALGYAGVVAIGREMVSTFSSAEQDLILGGTAATFWTGLASHSRAS